MGQGRAIKREGVGASFTPTIGGEGRKSFSHAEGGAQQVLR